MIETTVEATAAQGSRKNAPVTKVTNLTIVFNAKTDTDQQELARLLHSFQAKRSITLTLTS